MLATLKGVLPDTAQVNAQGHLVIGGCDVVDLAEESRFGTPLYVFDEETLRGRCREFLREFRSRYADTSVVYASKAYVNPALARIMMEEGLGLDVVSGGELAIAAAVDYPPEGIYFHGNNKSEGELRYALEYGIGRVVVDNFHELETLDRLAGEAKKVQDVMIRVSPGVDPHTHVYTTTGVLDSKFGFSVQTGHAEEAIRAALRSRNLNLVGLHFHLGSPLFEIEPYRVAVRLVLEMAAQLREEGLVLREFSPGGGFAISYTRDRPAPSIAEYAEAIASATVETCRLHGMQPPRLVVEPGRAIVGPAGVALYRVGAIKDIPGVRKYVSVDGGMGDNIRPALYEAAYETLAANKMAAQPSETVTIAGKYCESGDVLVRDAFLPPLESGDLVALPASGAYCLPMASVYNLNPRPPIVLVNGGEARLIRRRESYQDLISSELP